MGLVKIDESILTAIAGAIRSKLGVATTYKPNQMASAISSIIVAALETKSITANGTYTPSSGNNGFSSVTVNVPNSYVESDEGKVVSEGSLVDQTSQTVTVNGTYDTTLKNEVVVNVSSSATLQQKTATANGDVTADSGYDGLSKVTVAIPLANGVSF